MGLKDILKKAEKVSDDDEIFTEDEDGTSVNVVNAYKLLKKLKKN